MLQHLHREQDVEHTCPPVDGRLVIVDRMVDMPAACLGADTYCGMVDELYKDKDEARKVASDKTSSSLEDAVTLAQALDLNEEDMVRTSTIP